MKTLWACLLLVGCSSCASMPISRQLDYISQVNTVSILQLSIDNRAGSQMGQLWLDARSAGVEMGACVYGTITVLPDSVLDPLLQGKVWHRLTMDSIVPFQVIYADSIWWGRFTLTSLSSLPPKPRIHIHHSWTSTGSGVGHGT